MKHIRNALCILMTAAMILLAACSSAEPAADAGADITETAAETAIQETESAEKLVLPDGIDYKGAKVRVYLEGYLSEDFNVFYTPETEIGEVVNDAACDRTRQVEEMLNIDIEYVTSAKNDMSALMNSVVSYAGEFDLASSVSNFLVSYIAPGYLTDIYGLEGIDTERSWWLPNINSELEIEGGLYMASGYFDMATFSRTSAVFFSTKLAEDYSLGDFYALVEGDKWNYDAMFKLAAAVSSDLDGDGQWTDADQYGLCGGFNMNSMLIIASGYHFTKLDGDGRRVVSGCNEKLLGFNTMLYETYQKEWYYNCYPYKGTNKFSEAATKFTDDKYLFFLQDISNTRQFSADMDNYGILPIPKYDEHQDEYYAYSRPSVTSVPFDAKDPVMSSYVTEALNYTSKQLVLPAYYDIALSAKYTSTPEAAQMLDIIFAGAAVDFAQLWYTELKISPNLHNSVGIIEDYASWYESISESFNTNLENLLTRINEMQTARGEA